MVAFRNPIPFSSRASAVETLAELGWRPTDSLGATWVKISCAGHQIIGRMREALNGRWEVEIL